MATAGLPVNSLVSVSVNLTPPAAQAPTVNAMLILGDSAVIDTRERIRNYASLSAVAADFGTAAPEYLAAVLHFGQSPQPLQLYIGRWAKIATSGLLRGGALTTAEQALANFTAINNGGFTININGTGATNVTAINLTGAANLNAVAALIQAAVRAIGGGGFALATVTWNAALGQFTIASGTTGATSTVSATTPPAAGTDLGPLIKSTAATLTYTTPGVAAESAVAAVTIFDTAVNTPWYGLSFAPSVALANSDILAIAAYIEGATTSSGNGHLFGFTTADPAAIVSPDTTSINALVKALAYNRTAYQWSSTSAYAVVSLFARQLVVNPLGANTTITLMYKQEPGVVAEQLTQAQATALNASNTNYFAAFNNGTNIIVNGKVASGQYIDTIWNVDWLAGQIQTNVFNQFFATTTKIPQTDAGMQQIATGISAACQQGVVNGAVAPGIWTAGGFGQIKTGDYLGSGFYIFTPPLATQSPAARAARASVPIQVAVKLAGAVHTANVQIFVNP